MKKATLLLNNVSLRISQIHKFRGFIGNLFENYDVIHNHDLLTGKPIYRYPLIQFKLINKTPAIVAITEQAVTVFLEIFMKLDKIVIDDIAIPVFEKDLKVEEVEFGYSKETIMYEFNTPWIGLNQKNFRQYLEAVSMEEKNQMLKRALIGNLLSMSKYLNHWLKKDQEINVELQVRERNTKLKGKNMLGFAGIFKANFNIPDYLGIGKSVSRGFGSVKKLI